MFKHPTDRRLGLSIPRRSFAAKEDINRIISYSQNDKTFFAQKHFNYSLTNLQSSTTSMTSPAPQQPKTSSRPQRYAQIIRLLSSHAPEYIALHSRVWPSVLSRISASNIHDYSIFYDRQTSLLFASFKYTGTDFEGDMRRMSEDEEVRKWWRITDGMQESLNKETGARSTLEGGEAGWWRRCEEVFYTE
ncbi:MAG: hypothetical protein Q9160_000922 [Pyrenula sp. 1 TL-2023]